MRVLQISHNYHIKGGSDAVFFATSELLSRAGHDVIPFCMASEENLPSSMAAYFPSGANTRLPSAAQALKYFYNSEAVAKLERLLDDIGDVDVAHLHIYHGKQTPAILPVLRRRGIPIFQTLHEYKLACPVYTMQRGGTPCADCVGGSVWPAIKNRCKDGSVIKSAVMAAEFATARALGDVRNVDQFFCVSDFQRRIMAQANIPRSKLSTLHNFVDTETAAYTEDHDGYVLYFGRIEKLKGLETLIRTVAQTGTRLKIAGDGSWMRTLQKQAADMPHVDILGFKSGKELSDLVARSKAVVVPSEWHENCPMSVLEAKAKGKPVIGSNVGGIPELVRRDIDGYLFEPGDVLGLKDAFSKLERASYPRLARRAREDAEARFSAPAHLAKLVRAYRSVQAPIAIGALQPA